MSDNSRKQAALAPAYSVDTSIFSIVVPAGSEEDLYSSIKSHVKTLGRSMPLGVELIVFNEDNVNFSSNVDLLFDSTIVPFGFRLPHCEPANQVQSAPLYLPIFGKPSLTSDSSLILKEVDNILDAVVIVTLLY